MIKKLPEYWCIKNTDQIIRDWFAKEYKEPEIKKWKYDYIGYDGISSYNGVHGAPFGQFIQNNIEITFEEFKKLVLKKYIYQDLKYLKLLFKKLNIK